MGFNRATIFDAGLQRPARAGDGLIASPLLVIDPVNANTVLTAAQMAGGMIQYSSFSAGRNITTDSAANILAANPAMDIGDSIMIFVSIVPAFAGTLVAGAGVTLAGKATVVASGLAVLLFTRTGAATITCTVL